MSTTSYVRVLDNKEAPIYVGLKGKPITIKLPSDSVLSGILSIDLWFIKPDGDFLSKVATVYNLSERLIRYNLLDGDLDQRGWYIVQPYVNEDADTVQPYSACKFMVYGKGEFVG